jgi:RNA polymerase sigma factor (sigma-70 family)
MKTDIELLESYARHGSEADFRELVERRINLVHSAALRESKGNVSQAEDITQAVFTELARRADALVRHPALAGWLYTCVRRMTANVRRAEGRRQQREQEAFTMNELLSPDPNDKLWQQLRPVLDDVMHELNEEDRMAVVLRFFEGRSLKDVGVALGLNENAARMRVERSLEKLRRFLSQRGVKSTAATLTAALALGSVSNASAAFAASVAAGALSSAASNSSAALLSTAWAKIAAVGVAAVLTASLVVWHQVRANTANAGKAPSVIAASQPSTSINANAMDNATGPISAPTNSAAPTQMTLRVIEEETGAPLPRAKIYLAYFRDYDSAKVVKGVTDANGALGVDSLQPPFTSLNLFAAADGHVPKVVGWSFSHSLPQEYTMKMPQGATVAGVVRDEAGKPIADARIEFDVPGGNSEGQQENIQFGPDTAARTDTNGHWSCNMVPKDIDHVSLLITHTNHAETQAAIGLDAPDANNSIITMPAGFTIAGAVTDLNGMAIPKAKVRQVRMNSEGEASQKTDALGNFAFKNMKAGELMLAVQAEGFAPAVKTLQVTGPVTSLQFQLGPGCLLRGHVVDENGNPVPHAQVNTERDRMAFRKIVWSAKTGAAGRFEWDSAPQEPLSYSFRAEGFESSDLSLVADGSDHEIKLAHVQPGKSVIQITGTAVDADTGQPLDAFKVQFRRVEPDWVVPLGFGTAGKDGTFTLSLPAGVAHTNYQLELEKEGYLPALSANLRAKDGNQTLAFKLQKGSGPSGIVLLPNGEPAANAAVYLCTSQSGVTLDGPARVNKGINTTTYLAYTDDTGKFSLPAASAPEGVVVVHDQGFAQLSMAAIAAASNITLQAWGRVEGSLALDAQPATNATIIASHQITRYDDEGRYFGFLTYDFETTTDSAGKFSFEKVPPGSCEVFHRVNGFESDNSLVSITPGVVTQLALGGTGRPVIGRAVLTGVSGAINWPDAWVNLTSKSDNDPGPRPRRGDFASAAAFIQAAQSWRAAIDVQRRFSAFCDTNGSFRLQDIPSGTYELKIALRDPKLDSVSPTPTMGIAPEIATLVREVIVPEIPGGHSDEPLDLGTLELVPRHESASAQ